MRIISLLIVQSNKFMVGRAKLQIRADAPDSARQPQPARENARSMRSAETLFLQHFVDIFPGIW
ncbi:MAG: hypothetical protein C0600_12540 [Ignavibacteria bacterium]|nr:MAG: hypothetical protein C0600_12540 [Ignavibacteria bacterium]